MVSGVFDATLLQSRFRVWSRSGTVTSQKVKLPTEPLSGSAETALSASLKRAAEDDSFSSDGDVTVLNRQRIFGRVAQQRLAQLKVALIGCGGIGAPFAEQLSRLGVVDWTLIDPDRIEPNNLDRLPFATRRMADQRLSKVAYIVKSLIRRMWPAGSVVRALAVGIDDPRAQEAAARCDLLVVATDNDYSGCSPSGWHCSTCVR